MRFDYLHDPEIGTIAKLRRIASAPEMRVPSLVLLLVVVVELSIGGMLVYRCSLGRAQQLAAERMERVTASRLQRLKIDTSQVERLLALDARIHRIRGSGAVEAARVLDIANHLPASVWLRSIADSDKGEVLVGRAEGLTSIGDAVRDMMSASTVASPQLAEARSLDVKAMPNLMSFQMTLADRSK